MRMKPVEIVRETLRQADGASERERTVLEGVRHRRGEKIYLQFKEVLAEEMDAVPTLLTVENGGVWLHRKGDVGGDMLFAAGKRTAVAYRTPMGMLDLEIDTKRVDVFISEDILEIELKYNLIANEELLSEIEMNIRAE